MLTGLGGSKPLRATRSHFVGTRSHLAHALREVPRGLQTASYGARRLCRVDEYVGRNLRTGRVCKLGC